MTRRHIGEAFEVRLPPLLKSALQAEAQRVGVSMSEMIRRILEDYLLRGR